MIEKIEYKDMLTYSKELKENANVVASLIDNKDFPELQNFVEDIRKYATYLESIVKLHKSADDAIASLKDQVK